MHATLLLGDGRFPSGAHAHSFGVEAAVAAGLIRDLADLERWLHGALHTGWRTDAAVAVAAWRLADQAAPRDSWRRLDEEAIARVTAPLQRAACRRLGRQLLRACVACWPAPALHHAAAVHPEGPHAGVALGGAAAAAGVALSDVAPLALHHGVQAAASATVRLLGLDPYAVAGLCAGLQPAADAVAADVTSARDPAALPAGGGPLLDLLLDRHQRAEVRFFAT